MEVTVDATVGVNTTSKVVEPPAAIGPAGGLGMVNAPFVDVNDPSVKLAEPVF